MSQENLDVARRWFLEIWNDRNHATIDELLTPESICYTDDGPMRGPDEFRQRPFDPFVAAFPDLRIEIEAMLAQGDQVVVRWAAYGTHEGGGLGFPPTREPATFRGMSWIHIRDGRFCEGWQSTNIPEVVRALAAKATS